MCGERSVVCCLCPCVVSVCVVARVSFWCGVCPGLSGVLPWLGVVLAALSVSGVGVCLV